MKMLIACVVLLTMLLPLPAHGEDDLVVRAQQRMELRTKITKIEQDTLDGTAEVVSARSTLEKAQTEYDRLMTIGEQQVKEDPEVKQAVAALTKAETQQTEAEQSAKQAKQTARELGNKARPMLSSRRGLEKQHGKLQRDHRRAQQAVESTQRKINDIRTNKTGESTKDLQRRLERQQQEVTKLQSQISDIESQATTLTQEIDAVGVDDAEAEEKRLAREARESEASLRREKLLLKQLQEQKLEAYRQTDGVRPAVEAQVTARQKLTDLEQKTLAKLEENNAEYRKLQKDLKALD